MPRRRTRSETEPEQQYIPGTEPKKNNRVHTAAKRYAARRDERMAANEEEKAAHQTLLETMIEEGLDSYEYGDVEVHIDATKKVKVKIASQSNGDGEADEE